MSIIGRAEVLWYTRARFNGGGTPQDKGMARALTTGCLVILLTVAVSADQIELVDGRTFEGTATVEGSTVTIDMVYGSIRFSKHEVRRIVLMDTPEQELVKRLVTVSPDDPEALYEVACWAGQRGLPERRMELLSRVIQLDEDHPGARRLLGFVRIDERWYDFARAIELARSKLEAGLHRVLLEEVLPALGDLPLGDVEGVRVRTLLAETQLRAKRFGEAAATFASLARQTDGDIAIRHRAVAEILEAHPYGMYILEEPYPPGSALLGSQSVALKAGPVSLALPDALDAALRDRAKDEIDAGKSILDESRQLAPTAPEASRRKTLQASERFRRADALIPGIARSYHIEIVRRRVTALRKVVDADWGRFHQAVDTGVAREEMSPAAYRTMVLRLVHYVDNVRETLRDILAAAQPYPRELILEIEWAQVDLAKVEAVRDTLMAELGTGR
jgi:hypothetical protein